MFCRLKGSAFNGGGVIAKLCNFLFVYIFLCKLYSQKSQMTFYKNSRTTHFLIFINEGHSEIFKSLCN